MLPLLIRTEIRLASSAIFSRPSRSPRPSRRASTIRNLRDPRKCGAAERLVRGRYVLQEDADRL